MSTIQFGATRFTVPRAQQPKLEDLLNTFPITMAPGYADKLSPTWTEGTDDTVTLTINPESIPNAEAAEISAATVISGMGPLMYGLNFIHAESTLSNKLLQDEMARYRS